MLIILPTQLWWDTPDIQINNLCSLVLFLSYVPEVFITLAGECDLSALCGLLVQRNGLEPQVGPPHSPETQRNTDRMKQENKTKEQVLN